MVIRKQSTSASLSHISTYHITSRHITASGTRVFQSLIHTAAGWPGLELNICTMHPPTHHHPHKRIFPVRPPPDSTVRPRFPIHPRLHQPPASQAPSKDAVAARKTTRSSSSSAKRQRTDPHHPPKRSRSTHAKKCNAARCIDVSLFAQSSGRY